MHRVAELKFDIINFLRRYRGTKPIANRECLICGYKGRFGVQMQPITVDSICPGCGSAGRHRFFHFLLKQMEIGLEEPIIHFAAEPCLAKYLSKNFSEYFQVGLAGPDLEIDIETIDLQSGSIGSVIAHQVLEHVNDELALQEIWRILKPGGSFIFTTPVVENWTSTYENSNLTDPKSRLLFFGQHDHVRMYGRDIRDRIKRAGFSVNEHVASEPFISKFSFERGETLFVCKKEFSNLG